jgi:hypothetical protein
VANIKNIINLRRNIEFKKKLIKLTQKNKIKKNFFNYFGENWWVHFICYFGEKKKKLLRFNFQKKVLLFIFRNIFLMCVVSFCKILKIQIELKIFRVSSNNPKTSLLTACKRKGVNLVFCHRILELQIKFC